MEKRNEVIAYLENITFILLGILFLGFPLVILTFTTDAYILPKQILLGTVALITLSFLGIRMVVEKSVRIRRTPFDAPVLLFTVAVLLSSLFSINRADSLIAFAPLLFAVIVYFVLTNTARNKNNSLFLVSSLVLGAVIVSVVSVLSFFKIYLLPFNFTRAVNFTPIGSLFDQAIYLIVVLPVAGYSAFKLFKDPKNLNTKTVLFTTASIVIATGLFVTIYQLFTSQKPIILPFETGFQTAFAAISQDAGRILQGFLVGSGFGTYATDFTRFKQIAFNQNQTLWSLTFFRSSSAILEFLATIGVLGVSAFIFLVVRITREIKNNKQNKALLSLSLALIGFFVLPLSFINQTLFFIVLGLFAVLSSNFFDIEFQLVSFKKGLLTLEPVTPKISEKRVILPFVFLIILLIVSGGLGYLAARFLLSDIAFQQSLLAAGNNNGAQTYQKQSNAISFFRYRDVYYRVFSQTNLALANSILAQQPRGSSPSAQTQQTITTLIQQSINAGRNSTSIAPQTSLNWQSLSSIYRGLIGFGQNAENFALASQQQATALDPNNPQEYINLGGIYYQLGNYDNAQTQFQIAINLKPDYANAYYNLGHVFINKNDFANALAQFQIVKNLVAQDKNSLSQITKEIGDLQKRSSTQNPANPTSNLNLNTPTTQLPPQNPPVKIPGPATATEAGK